MKSIDIKSFIIGILITISIILTISATSIQEKKYSGFTSSNGVFLLDTTTGDLWKFKAGFNNYYWNKWTSKDPFKPKGTQ